MKHKFVQRLCTAMSAFVLLLGLGGVGLSASAAEEHITISIHNTDPGTDINTFLRFVAKQAVFKTGGPFTVKMDVKMENFRRMSTEHGASYFFNVMTKESVNGQQDGGQISEKSNADWHDFKRADGKHVTFSNVDKGTIIDGQLQKYYLLDFGLFYAKGDLSFRNFRIENAGGKVVYSWDTDPDLLALLGNKATANLKDIGMVEPEPMILAANFSDGSARVLVSKTSGDSTPNITTSSKPGPVYEDENSMPPSVHGKTSTVGKTSTTGKSTVSNADTESTILETESSEMATETAAIRTTNATITTAPAVPPKKNGLGVGAIIGIVIAAIVVLGGGTVGVLFATKKLPLKKD